jgi:hypothetical protein
VDYRMIETIRTLSTGENIFIYDNVFEDYEIFKFQSFVETSYYKVGSVSFTVLQMERDSFLRCQFSNEDLDNFGLFNSTNILPLQKHFTTLKNSWVVLSTHMSQYHFHSDDMKYDGKSRKTLLYYVNNKWDKDWGGETLFCNSKGEVEMAVEFRPNRIVVFDNSLMHKPAPISLSSYPYRYCFVAQFN